MVARLREGVPHPMRTSAPHHPSSYSSMNMEMLRRSSNVDEGFSEETRSPSDSDMIYAVDTPNASVSELLQMVLALPAETRRHFAEELVRSLANSDKEAVKALVEDLTHFDPALYFPNEIMFQVLSYLSPKDLLTSSTVSRSWRGKSQDERLWQCCFAREGWRLDAARMQAFERFAGRRGARVAANAVRRSVGLERRESRKRKTEEAFSEGEAGHTSQSDAMLASNSEPESENPQETVEDVPGETMEGVEPTAATEDMVTVGSENPSTSTSITIDPFLDTPGRRSSSGSRELVVPSSPSQLKLRPSLFQDPHSEHPKLSWPYLYKQRRRLEMNWENGLYKMFQIPHPDFLNEGHEECVYAIQHTSRHLVSGSRDKTIRIWDLDTCRLKLPPLKGHDASVLCVQFDEREDHDIVVSGGSDAYVIIWQFSTGRILRKMTAAHAEPVLNLRFDDRYIVTCSKDKTIKIWNRRALARDDPLIPSHVLNNFNAPKDPHAGELLREFTLLATLTGHHAAVNAVMIHENTIVSASGDRTIRGWDINTGMHKKTYTGHTKGIACVQFDGRRIVSGSSDNTVRIFDADSQVEISCLTGHTDLVRTVQARFGDLETTTDAELEHEAKMADRAFYKAVARGMTPAPASRRNRNAGSSRPEQMQALGSKIPPGGGGSRWAKIVSGSYDEAVILWKRDYEGKWQVKHRLRQDMLLRSGRTRRHIPAATLPPQQANQTPPQAQTPGPAAQQQQQPAGPSTQAQHFLAAAHHHLASVNALLSQPAGTGASTIQQQAALIGAQNALTAQLANQAVHAPQSSAAATNPTNADNTNINTNTNATAAANPPAITVTAASAPVAAAAPPPPPTTQPQGHAHQAHLVQQNRDSNRVFKLQFDARRLLCCSQNKIIVGWDFANGDKELERIGEWSIETS